MYDRNASVLLAAPPPQLDPARGSPCRYAPAGLRLSNVGIKPVTASITHPLTVSAQLNRLRS